MFHIVLFEPEIPPNTGNIMRLCANTGGWLHLVEPLGFELDDTRLRRAGLDYQDRACVQTYDGLETYIQRAGSRRLFACSTRGGKVYTQAHFTAGDAFLFGPETRGLPEPVMAGLGTQRCLRIPMITGSRSLNLSNAVAIVLFEAWRQCAFMGAAQP